MSTGDESKLANLYQIRFSRSELLRKNAIWQVLCNNFFNDYINHDDVVVDIACGYGEFINNIRAKQKIALDLNSDSKSFLREDVIFHQSDALDISRKVSGDADVIFMSNFLEHLPDKKVLEKLLDQCMIALKPGGRLIILGPNLRYLPGKYWDFYDHHLGLTHVSLLEILKLKGFLVDTCIDKFLPYTTQGSLPTWPFLVKIYLKFPFVWKFLGKQFFVVSRKSL